MNRLTAAQLARLAALVPGDLAQPETLPDSIRMRIRWQNASALERLLLVRLFGRARQRALLRPAMELLPDLQVTIRDLAKQVIRDADVQTVVHARLDRLNDGPRK
jgi:hypothetical protein